MTDSFYVTLPSDGSMESFPESTISHFKNKLPTTLEFKPDEWELAMTEMQYPTSTFNVRDCYIEILMLIPASKPQTMEFNLNTKYELTLNQLSSEVREKYKRFVRVGRNSPLYSSVYTLKITDGYYKNSTVLIESIRDTLNTNFPDSAYSFPYSKHKKIFSVNKASFNNQLIRFSENLACKLGIEDPNLWMHSYRGIRPISLNCGSDSLFVYCDIVRGQIVGSRTSPLLRVVPFTTETDLSVHHFEVRHRDYLPLSKRFFDSIEIDIRNEIGQRVAFMNSKVIVKLHFRRREA